MQTDAMRRTDAAWRRTQSTVAASFTAFWTPPPPGMISVSMRALPSVRTSGRVTSGSPDVVVTGPPMRDTTTTRYGAPCAPFAILLAISLALAKVCTGPATSRSCAPSKARTTTKKRGVAAVLSVLWRTGISQGWQKIAGIMTLLP